MMIMMTMMFVLVAADTITSDSSVTVVTGDEKLDYGDITTPTVTTTTDSGLARSFGALLMAVMAVMHV